MVLANHSDAAYLNFSKDRSQSGAHIIFSEEVPVPRYNFPDLTIAKIINCVISPTSKS